jgi:formylglycine-generating enzyme required for sulfatase activity
MRLCTATEWQTACEGPGGAPPALSNKYSFSTTPTTYTAGVCNDDNGPGSALWATGSGAGVAGKMCYTDWGAAGRLDDMSGNVYEWTSSCFTSSGNQYCNTRGGSFTSFSDGTFPDGTSCEFSFFSPPPTYANADVGFRCCANAPP